MAKDIEPKLKTISSYFKLGKKEHFIIPEYQRGYSWTINQCDKLSQDIESFIDSDGDDNYFFGTVIVDCSNTNQFGLIDGQQRTTTFLLLLKALLVRLNEIIPKVPDDEDNESLKAGLKANRNKIMSILYKAEDEDIPAMLKDASKTKDILILENKSINELYKQEVKTIIEASDYNDAEQSVYKIPKKQKDNKYTNHFRNFKFFYDELSKKNETAINKFAKILLNNCEVIEIRSWNIEQAITMFNSLNSTGLPLSDSDIISAHLYSNSSENRDDFEKQWKELNELANKLNQAKIVSLDNILQQYMYIYRAIKKEYIAKKDDGGLSIDVTTPGLRRYYTEIEKNALLSDPIDLCEKLMDIAQKWDKVKDYPIVKIMLKHNENIKLFLAGYLYRFEIDKISQESILIVCECLLRLFTLLEVGNLGYSSSNFKKFLFGEIAKLVDNQTSVDEIKQDFDHHIADKWRNDDIEQLILDYEKNILVFLNEYLFAKSKELVFDFADNVNIEHIMPSSGRNIDTIRQDAGIASGDEFKLLVNKLGNKILLEEDINKSIGRDWFKTKKQNKISDKKGYKNSRFGLAQSLVDFESDIWTGLDIENATNESAKRISDFIFAKSLSN